MEATTSSTDMKPPPKMHPPIRVDALDGIRALAALWVMCQHGLNFLIPVQWHQGWKGLFTAWLGNAHFAVALFIVLSGFCLTIPVARHGALREGAVTFFMRRARRILPTYYAALMLALVLNIYDNSIGYLTFHLPKRMILANFLLLTDWLPEHLIPPIVLPFWSVSAEWKIYFLFPLIVGILLRYGVAPMIAFGALASVLLTGVFLTVAHGMPLIYTCPWYLLLFCLGVAGGQQVYGLPSRRLSRTPLLMLGCGSLAALVVAIIHQQPFNWYLMAQDILAGIAAAALLTALASGLPRSRAHDGLLGFLSWRPLVRLGTMSYSLYLIHVPLLRTLFHTTETLLPGSRQWTWKEHCAWHLLILFPIVICLTYFFHLVAERPFIGKRRKETPAEMARDAALSPAP